MKKIISLVVVIFTLTTNLKAQTKTETVANTMQCNMQGLEKCRQSDKAQKCNMADCKEVCKDNQSKCNHSDSNKCDGTDCKKGKMKNMPMKDCPMMKG
jgi:hypothetical protein